MLPTKLETHNILAYDNYIGPNHVGLDYILTTHEVDLDDAETNYLFQHL